MAQQIDLVLTLQSPLHIGGETRLNTSADRPLLKTANGLPYVPATTVKGALRHRLEQFLPSSGGTPRPDAMPQPLSEQDRASLYRRDAVNRLFGTPWLESKLYFNDLYLSGPAELVDDRGAWRYTRQLPPSTIRYGVGINPRRRVARDQVLYTTELFAPGIPLAFSGSINVASEDTDDIVLLVAVLRTIDMLGSGRSRGLGWCSISVSAPVYPPEQVRAVLTRYLSEGER